MPNEFHDGRLRLHAGDCLDMLRTFPDDHFDAIVTDPPYELGFMGKHWDNAGIAFDAATWAAALRVLKPGGHIVAFGAPKNYHRLACAIEDAGFEVRDCIMWITGQGFPKSHNLPGGFGSALKPAYEPIVLCRKPLSEPTISANVLRWGTGALNIDGCRIEPTGESRERIGEASQERRYTENGGTNFAAKPGIRGGSPIGRWPANLCHDGLPEVLAGFPVTNSMPGKTKFRGDSVHCYGQATQSDGPKHDDAGSAARFFYCAKASRHDRCGSKHPTVKPVSLMRWLVRLVTPPGGLILDPFAGTGTTGQAALLEGFRAVLIEREDEYRADIRRRFEQPEMLANAE